MLNMGPPRITDEMYARIPALLEQGMTKAEIAAMLGVTLGSLRGVLLAAWHLAAQGQAACAGATAQRRRAEVAT